MRRKKRVWTRANNPTLINLIIGGVVSGVISFAILPSLKRFFGVIELKFGPVIFTTTFLSFGAIVYAALQAIHYRKLSKSTKKTVVHYLKMLKDITPLGPTIVSLQILFLISLFFLGRHLGVPTQELKKPISLVFFCIALPLGLMGWVIVGTWYRWWVLTTNKTIVEALSEQYQHCGLIEYPAWNNKDETISEILSSLEKCHFIFIWGIHFSEIIGRDNPDALDLIGKLFVNNKGLNLFLLLQCPFCKEVIERAIELDSEYDDEYIEASVKSISNCAAQGRARNAPVKVSLAHTEPFIRSILWGRLKEGCTYRPLSIAEKPSDTQNILDFCLEYMNGVEWGGFTLQQYHLGINGCYSPLYKGSVLAHGGLWNRIRCKFAEEFLKGVDPYVSLVITDENNKDVITVDKVTLEHLACDFGLSKRKVNKSSEKELCKFIYDKTDFPGFIQRIRDKTNTMATTLRQKAGEPSGQAVRPKPEHTQI